MVCSVLARQSLRLLISLLYNQSSPFKICPMRFTSTIFPCFGPPMCRSSHSASARDHCHVRVSVSFEFDSIQLVLCACVCYIYSRPQHPMQIRSNFQIIFLFMDLGAIGAVVIAAVLFLAFVSAVFRR